MSYSRENYKSGWRYSPAGRFRPKRPIRSFRDLGIYQTTEQISVEIMKKLVPAKYGAVVAKYGAVVDI